MSRSRVSTARNFQPLDPRAIAGGGGSAGITAGALAAATWLRAHGGSTSTEMRWYVEIALDILHQRAPSEFDERTASRFHLDIYAEEWGVFFCHRGHASWIRVTDIAFVHGRDDFRLIDMTPRLNDIGTLLRRLEATHSIRFLREHASIKTNLPALEPTIRAWVATL